MSELVRRAEATDRTLALFRDKAFDWQGVTCIHLARAHLRHMRHKVPAMPRFRSLLGARKAMKAAGYESVGDIFDALHLAPIPAGMMLVGDLATLPGDAGFDSVVVNAGTAFLGFHEDAPGLRPIVDAIEHVTGAWRL